MQKLALEINSLICDVKNYYFLGSKIKRRTAFADTQGETPIAHELVPDVIGKTQLPFDLHLKDSKLVKGELIVSNDLDDVKHLWQDYQPNHLAWPLMSRRMMQVVSSMLTGKEGIFWIRANVRSADDCRDYYIPEFTKELDVLDETRTIYADGTSLVVKPVFSLKKVYHLNFFHIPRDTPISTSIIVSNQLVEAMIKEGLTGVDFGKMSAV